MPPKKLTFADLGLTVALPEVLAKSKTQRKEEQRLRKKADKQRLKEAVSEIAESRTATEQHKTFVEAERQKAQAVKRERKRDMRVEQAKSHQQRETERKEENRQFQLRQKEYYAQVMEESRADKEQQEAVRALLEARALEQAKSAPANVSVVVHRTAEIEEQRQGLPVLREEQPIMEAITHAQRSCVLICGETGSGKTTQVPQFLWEAGYGHAQGAAVGRDGCVLVTEPRRVAAVSMAQRVAAELNVTFGKEVCYHVRYDNNLSDECRLKFATEGIALKEIQSDFLLRKYSAIVVDEAHERSISCDLLVGLLSRIVPLRNELYEEELAKHKGDATKVSIKPLKFVIMSATLRVADFRDNRSLFPITPPLINVEARRFPVANHFERRTEMKDYAGAAFQKVCQIHKKLPPGGVLVFLCTQQEIEDLCARLRAHYRKTKIEYYDDAYSKQHLLTGKDEFGDNVSSSEADAEAPLRAKEKGGAGALEKDEYGLCADDYDLSEVGRRATGGKHPRQEEGDGGSTNDEDGEGDERGDDEEEEEVNGEFDTLYVLPLYALLDFHKQQRVFQAPPKGKRLCIVSTNVAETSITIPNIKYVVDAGRVKCKTLDADTMASCYRIEWISQASAEQRSGRAGRVGPGHCYRLYSTAVYTNVMPKHSTPEILRTPLDSVVLLMRHVGIDHVGRFPFPSPPAESDLKSAFRHLSSIGALDKDRKFEITAIGRQLISFPVPPRFARAVVEVLRKKMPSRLLDMVLAIVAMNTSTTNLFTAEGNRLKTTKDSPDDNPDPRRGRIRALLVPGSDLVTNLRAFLVYSESPTLATCYSCCLVQKSMREATMLFNQLRRIAQSCHSTAGTAADGDALAVEDTNDFSEASGPRPLAPAEEAAAPPSPPSPRLGNSLTYTRDEEVVLRQVFIPGLIDQVARLATVHECRSLGVDYHDTKTSKAAYIICSTRSLARIHPTSAVSRTFPPPEYVTFCFLQKVSRTENKEASTMMLGVTIVTKDWLTSYGFDDENGTTIPS